MVNETKMLLVANVKIFPLSLQLFNPQLDMMTVIKQNTVKNCTQRTEGGRENHFLFDSCWNSSSSSASVVFTHIMVDIANHQHYDL